MLAAKSEDISRAVSYFYDTAFETWNDFWPAVAV